MNKLSILLLIAAAGAGILCLASKNCCKQDNKIEKNHTVVRATDFKVDDLFPSRQSKRAMSGEALSKDTINSLLEAVRWAPSCYNEQPWRVLFAVRGSSDWNTFFNLMVPFNQSWAKDAGALVVFVSRDTFSKNGKPNLHGAFDTGAAWENLALQGSIMGLVVHAMGGIDFDKAKNDLHIPDGYSVLSMVAIGKPGPIENLPADLQQAEKSSSSRKKVEEFSVEGLWNDTIN